MSLLRSPRHVVTVHEPQVGMDEDGVETTTAGRGVEVRCNVHPVSASEAEQYGLTLSDAYRITAPPGVWPGSPRALVTWEGDVYHQMGRPVRSRMGRATQHDRIYIHRGNDG